MSGHQENHPDPTAKAVAVLAASIVQTLGESDPAFLPAFEKNLSDMYSSIRDNNFFPRATLETITLVRDLLRDR